LVPSEDIVCGSGHMLDRVAESLSRALGAGTIDGPASSTCTVPSTLSWLLAGIVLFVFAVLAARQGSAARAG
jgi:hypothetical protein